MMFDRTDTYPVGLFMDWRRRNSPHAKFWRFRYLRRQIKARNWRAVRNYFNGYLAEHEHGGHNAGRGWTKRAANRRVERICATTTPADRAPGTAEGGA